MALLQQIALHEHNLPCFLRYLEPCDRILVALAVLEHAPHRITLLRFLLKYIPGAWLEQELLTLAKGYGCSNSVTWLRQPSNWSRVILTPQPTIWGRDDPCDLDMRAIRLAVTRNDVITVQRLVAQDPRYWQRFSMIMETATNHGHLEVAQWLAAEHEGSLVTIPFPNKLELELLVWVEKVGLSGAPPIVRFITRRTHGRFYHPSIPASTCQNILDAVAGSGDLELLEALVTHYSELPSSPARIHFFSRGALKKAARGGHLHILNWLAAFLDEAAKEQAGKTVDDEDAKRMMNKEFRIDEYIISEAAKKGHLQVVKWLLARWEPQCPGWKMNIPMQAALDALANGFVDVFQLLAALTKMDKWRVFHRALAINRLDIAMQYRSYNRCIQKLSHIEVAATRGHLEIVQWLYTNANSGQKDLRNGFLPSVVCNGHFHAAAWLLENRLNVDFHLDNSGRLYGKVPFCGSLRSEPPCCDRPWWALRYIKLCLSIRPKICSQCKWLPHWAIHCGEVELLNALETINHPQLFSRANIEDASNLTSINQVAVKSWYDKRRHRYELGNQRGAGSRVKKKMRCTVHPATPSLGG